MTTALIVFVVRRAVSMNLPTASLVSCLHLVDSTSKGVPICNGNGQLILIVKKETVMLCSSNSAN